MKIYIIDVTMFEAISSPSTAQFVKNRYAKEYGGQFPKVARAIVDSTDTVKEEVKFVHFKGGFEIRSWVSNS